MARHEPEDREPPVDPASVTALVVAARSGDPDALDVLLAGHLPLVYAVVRRALTGSADVDDVVQETMLRAVRGLPSLREPEKFRSWLTSIAVHLLRDRARQRDRGPIVSPLALDDLERVARPTADFVDSTHDLIDLAEQRQEVIRASQWLSPADRRVLVLWWQESAGALTRAEVVAALALSPPHTAVRIQRMKARLDAARRLLRAWLASPRCAELTDLAQHWDQRFHPRWLNRLSKHVRDCVQCTAAGRSRSALDHLVVGAGPLPVPPELLALLPTMSGAAASGAAASGAAAAHSGIGWIGAHVVVPVLRAARRTLGHLGLKPAAALGAGAAGVTAVVLAIHYPASEPSLLGQAPPATTRPAGARPTGSTPATVPTATGTPAPTAGPADPPAAGVTAADLYVAPGGSDTDPGTLDRPLATLAAAVAAVQPGQTIALRGGTYQPTSPVLIATSGTAAARITLSNYLNERPVLDAARIPANRRFISQTASYWTVQGLEIQNSPGHAYGCLSCKYNVFQRLSIHDSGNSALILEDPGTVGNLVADSDFFANHDTVDNGGSADGLGIKNGSGPGNVVRNCRLYQNSGDGLDLSEFTDPVTVTGTWAYGNGFNRWNIPNFTGRGNGIKLGGGSPAPPAGHQVSHSASWDNAGYGFTEAGNSGRLVLTNNTAFRNGADGFAFVNASAVLRHNLALANTSEVWLGGAVDAADNSWNQSDWKTTDLRSGDPRAAEGPRGPDWSLPASSFLLNRRDATMGASMRASP